MFEAPDESLVRAAVAIFAVLALSVSFGRSTWFWLRRRVWPVMAPRDRRERVWHRSFSAALAALPLLCVARLAGDPWYSWTLPFRDLETRAGTWLSIATSIAGLGGALLAQSQMGASWRIGIPKEATALVTRGLYGRVRNPIYSGLLLALAGLVALLPGAASVAIFAVSLVSVRAWVGFEEARQLETHGEEYRRYREATGRFLPRLRR